MAPDDGSWGRKVFFLYPHSVLNDELLTEILSNEYEVYCLRSHDAAVKVATKFPGSIFFVNIDEELKEHQWEAWIRRLISTESDAAPRVGIMTYNPDANLARKYLMDMGLPCGFIQLKLGLAEAKSIILKTLEANEARGRRRYVRARCADPKKASLNVNIAGQLVTGAILDISAAGMTFRFDTTVTLKDNAVLRDIQLRMKGTLCRVSGSYAGKVRGEAARNLLMFDTPVPEETQGKIHRFIYQSLQEEMGEIIKSEAG